MVRESNRLNAKFVEAVIKEGRTGRYQDGGGLRLQAIDGSVVWVWRGTVKSKRRELGIGPAQWINTLKTYAFPTIGKKPAW